MQVSPDASTMASDRHFSFEVSSRYLWFFAMFRGTGQADKAAKADALCALKRTECG